MTIPLLSSLIGLGKRDALRVLIRQYIWYPLFPRMSLINRGIAHEFIELYDGLQLQNVDSKADYFGFGLIHYSLVTNIKPKRILCIGSKKGFIPAVCALACRDNRFGTVDFVDAGFGEQDGKRQWGGIGLWKQIDPRRHFSFLGIGQLITPYIMTTEEFFARYTYQYDYIYIDGDHSYEGAKRDYKLSWKSLDVNGYMVFHDTSVRHMPGQPKYGVYKVWKEIPAKEKMRIDVSGGLAIVRKT